MPGSKKLPKFPKKKPFYPAIKGKKTAVPLKKSK